MYSENLFARFLDKHAFLYYYQRQKQMFAEDVCSNMMPQCHGYTERPGSGCQGHRKGLVDTMEVRMDCTAACRTTGGRVSERRITKRGAGTKVVRRRKIALYLIAVAIIVVTVSTLLLCSMNAEAAPAETSVRYYASVRVQDGDTLWKIADRYFTDECGSMRAYIREICLINHISGNDIHAGQYLTIPYYHCVHPE